MRRIFHSNCGGHGGALRNDVAYGVALGAPNSGERLFAANADLCL